MKKAKVDMILLRLQTVFYSLEIYAGLVDRLPAFENYFDFVNITKEFNRIVFDYNIFCLILRDYLSTREYQFYKTLPDKLISQTCRRLYSLFQDLRGRDPELPEKLDAAEIDKILVGFVRYLDP